ncbi:MAG: GNAT family N-acetyltransferase [Anaerolineales bacterium]|nr:GNAT family N-acetyltransferase [Anaerolineales bacterium]
MEPIPIRPAGLDDADALTNLILDLGWFQHYFEGASPDDAQVKIARQLRLTLTDDSHTVYVAENLAGEIEGYVSVHWLPYLFMPGPEGFISELFVRETARGQGIGSGLLAQVKTAALERGCSRLSLLNMRPRESYQRGFYTKQGWDERPDAANFVLRLK